MIDLKKNKIFRAAIHGMCFFLSLIIINGVIFLHYHINANGKLVVHSHISRTSNDSANNKSGPAKHRHSNTEYYILDANVNINNICLFSPAVYMLHIFEQNIDLPVFFTPPSIDQLCSISLRAPPLG